MYGCAKRVSTLLPSAAVCAPSMFICGIGVIGTTLNRRGGARAVRTGGALEGGRDGERERCRGGSVSVGMICIRADARERYRWQRDTDAERALHSRERGGRF